MGLQNQWEHPRELFNRWYSGVAGDRGEVDRENPAIGHRDDSWKTFSQQQWRQQATLDKFRIEEPPGKEQDGAGDRQNNATTGAQ